MSAETYCRICVDLGYTHTTKEPAMNKQTSPQHEAIPTAETIEAERKAKRWYDMNGTTLPRWGAHRKPSIMAVDEAEAEEAA